MKRVTLIQCTNSKRSGSHQAQLLYDESSYFRAMRNWAVARGQPWYILSAKHGLLDPDTVIEDYDSKGISYQQACEIARELDDMGVDVVDVTAGMDYTNHLVPELESRGIDVINHFAGLGIGNRKKRLKEETKKLAHHKL